MAREGEVSHLFMLGVWGGESALINCQLMQIMYLYINITLQTSPLTLTLPNRLGSVDMSVSQGPIRSAFPVQHEEKSYCSYCPQRQVCICVRLFGKTVSRAM